MADELLVPLVHRRMSAMPPLPLNVSEWYFHFESDGLIVEAVCREAKRSDLRTSLAIAENNGRCFPRWLSSTIASFTGIFAAQPCGRDGRAGVLGGNGLAVSRFSAHTLEAMELIWYLRKKEPQFLRATQHFEPSKDSIYMNFPPSSNCSLS